MTALHPLKRLMISSFFFDVIEHIGDEKSFLESALFYLRPGGKLLINVPYGNSHATLGTLATNTVFLDLQAPIDVSLVTHHFSQ
jgi:2-polyprenyl-3-methyl-5-hydroxy-6-metoxy-1,4-benzoquinol methylase